MQPHGRIWQELTWSWAYSTGHHTSDQRLEAAAKAAWPCALLCAWTYLNDHAAAHDLMDHAVENAFNYLGRHTDCSDRKLALRIKSVIKRRARQQSAKKSREIQYGSLLDLGKVSVGQSEAEQRVYANELFARLSPFAQSIVEWRWLGYSWRKIAEHLDMDHTAVRRAYFREGGIAAPRPLPAWRSPMMPLRLRGRSSPEDRFEAWIVQRHQERVLEGNAIPAGPCPDEDFLSNLAAKSRQIQLSDPRVEHAANCPICMRRLVTMRRKHYSRRLTLALRVAVTSCLLIAALLVVLAHRGTKPTQEVAERAAVRESVDLWNAGTFRGDPLGPLQAVSLPAALVKVTIILPRYSEPGR